MVFKTLSLCLAVVVCTLVFADRTNIPNAVPEVRQIADAVPTKKQCIVYAWKQTNTQEILTPAPIECARYKTFAAPVGVAIAAAQLPLVESYQ